MTQPKIKSSNTKNGNAQDNRWSNLREATQAENMRNRYFLRTQHPGVHLARWNRNKWTACIYFEGKHYHLGTFDTFEEACEARKEATKKFFGEFAPILEAE